MSTSTKLATQYGGNSVQSWVGYLPPPWVPYAQLTRLSPPVGLSLIYFPHAFGLLLGAIKQQTSVVDLLRAGIHLFIGSFFFSNANHIYNDLIDYPLDAKVERTKRRPISRGAVSPVQAFVFASTQAAGAALCLYYMTGDAWQNFLHASPCILGCFYYPFAKRHVHAPQLVLGFCLAYGVIIGSKAVGYESYSWDISKAFIRGLSLDPAAISLFLANLFWTMIFDTIYAHQDVEDDIKVGIKSLAVLFRHNTKTLLWTLQALMLTALYAAGQYANLSLFYYVLAVAGSAASMGSMIAFVDLRDSASCWYWFGTGFWYTGGLIMHGLVAEYARLKLTFM